MINLLCFVLDYGISKDEFLRMQKEDFYHRLGEEMTPEFAEIMNLRFEHTDTDQSGYIDWDEYLNYECTRRIYRMPNVTFFLVFKLDSNRKIKYINKPRLERARAKTFG